MKKHALFFLVTVFFLASCEKDANIPLPQTDPQLTVYCFLEVGKPIELKLGNMVPAFANPRRDPEKISGALIILRHGTSEFQLTEVSGDPGMYTHPHQVEAGGHYTLYVEVSGYPSLHAECTTPTYSPDRFSMQYKSSPQQSFGGSFSDSLRRISFSWPDEANARNYYRISARFGYQFSSFPPTEETIYFSERNYEDNNTNGEEIQSVIGNSYISTPSSFDHLYAELELMMLDEHAYRYMRTYDVAYFSEDNPFAEPVIRYSNISGGIGVFGALIRKFYSAPIY